MDFDYRGLQALSTIVELQSFEAAAERLHISQSAVSQRLKALQQRYSDPLLLRGEKYELTELATILINHYKKVHYLENQTSSIISGDLAKLKITIAVSRDILEIWFLQVMAQKELRDIVTIDVISDDAFITYRHVQKGSAHCSLGSSDILVSGCSVERLATMRYLLVSTKEFAAEYFSKGVNKKSIELATMLKFDEKDNLNSTFFREEMKLSSVSIKEKLVPSVQGFKESILRGESYALMPVMQVKEELESGELINLLPNAFWDEKVFFHYWVLDDKNYKNAISLIKSSIMRIFT